VRSVGIERVVVCTRGGLCISRSNYDVNLLLGGLEVVALAD
jgi:hypothetical protein